MVTPQPENLAAVVKMVESGIVKVFIDKTFHFTEVRQVNTYIEQGYTKGKIVLEF